MAVRDRVVQYALRSAQLNGRYCGGKSRNALSMAWLIVLVVRSGLELRVLVATPRQIIALREASHTSMTSVPWVTVVGRVVEDVTPNPTRCLLRLEPLQVSTPECVV